MCPGTAGAYAFDNPGKPPLFFAAQEGLETTTRLLIGGRIGQGHLWKDAPPPSSRLWLASRQALCNAFPIRLSHLAALTSRPTSPRGCIPSGSHPGTGSCVGPYAIAYRRVPFVPVPGLVPGLSRAVVCVNPIHLLKAFPAGLDCSRGK